MVEPPGIFMGRGSHPLRGSWKPRIHEEDVTLNVGEGDEPKGKWTIVHDHSSMWIARWIDKLGGKEKYVWLHDSASLRQERDRAKYESAAKLAGKIERVRQRIRKGLSARNRSVRAIASVCYLIDKLSMRVGDEKEEDEADTVGASTLRVEHIKLGSNSIHFDFLGKDSVRWEKTLNPNKADSIIVDNFELFLKGKPRTDLVFDGIRSSTVNRFLGTAMPSLTAKVFRTFHATSEARDYLGKHDTFKESDLEYGKIFHARMANLQAAVRCNHKKTPPKSWDESLAKKEERLEKLLSQEPKTDKARERLQARIEKQRLTIDLAKRTKEYNLSTSLKNYIDPRLYKAWSRYVGLDWTRIYTKSLQRKMGWVGSARASWHTPKKGEAL